MKKLFLPLLLVGNMATHAQDIKEWLSLTPIPVEKPALSEIKDVKNKTFSDAMLAVYDGINIQNLRPAANRKEGNLQWTVASMEKDTVTASSINNEFSLNYYASYIDNPDWISGTLTFKLFGYTDIYIDGEKKISHIEPNISVRTINVEWLPGKHTILVKSLSQGGKTIYASFKANQEFAEAPIHFTILPQRGKCIYDVLNGINVNQLEVSPSGKYAIIGISKTRGGKSTSNTHIYKIDTKEIVYSVFGNSISNLQWIPGKDEISFLQKEGNGQSLYSYNIEQRKQTCLIKEDSQLQSFTWSPDCSYLIYAKTENYSDPQWELRKLAAIEDRQAYFRNRSHLCKYDFKTGLHTRLTWGNLTTSLMDISSDGKKLLFATYRPDYTEYPYDRQCIYLLDMATLQTDILWKDRLYSINCSFSPDSKKLLIQGGPSAFGKTGEHIGKKQIANQYDSQLYIYHLDDKQVEAISVDFNPSIENAIWHKNGKIYAKTTDADFVRLYCYENGKFTRINCPGDMILNTSLASDANFMMYTSTTVHYPVQIYTLNLTDNTSSLWDNPNKEEFQDIIFGEMKDWDYQYNKNTLIDGRYYLPADFDPNKKYPLIVYYYGGTTPVSRSFGGRWPFNLYTANGYVVYVLQPSGAIGYGQEFSARHQNNWGKITGDEIIASTRAFIKAHPFIDAKHVGCMGASYGGFTTEYLTTQTDLFACAISHAGISSISSYWGEGYWGYAYSTNASAFAFPWNRRDIYVDQSPLFNADKVQVPILLIHGTADVNVPTGESIQFYTALKLLGKDVELVLVKNADHAVVDYNQRILWNNTILSYFAKYLKGKPAWWEHQYKDLNL